MAGKYEKTDEKSAKVHQVWKAYEEAKHSFIPLYDEMREDFEFYMSKQWKDSDLEIAAKSAAPTLVLNYIKKMADVISGFERQAPSDIKAFPIEGGDQRTAEVYSRLMKWIMTDRNMNSEVSRAFKDAIIGGVGWLAPSVEFDKDIINGDIEIRKVDPFNILVDPHFKEPDLSDADYIIKHTRMSKDKLKRLFPKFADVIEGMGEYSFDNDGLREETLPPSDQNKRLLIIEYWYREIESRTLLIDPADSTTQQIFEGDKDELEQIMQENPNLRKLIRKVNVIKYCIVAGNQLLYDGDNPTEVEGYPIVPVWGYFDTSNKFWKYRVSGLIRHLKDAQREKNKRRSVLMQILNKMPQYGWITDDENIDQDALKNGNKILKTRPGRMLAPMPQMQLPASAVSLEQMFDGDMLRIGTNLDTLGQAQDRGEPGVVISQRIRQGLMSHQELFDNLAFAKRMLGRQIVSLIGKNYSKSKILRILGEDLQIVPPELEGQVKQSVEQASRIKDQGEAEKQKILESLDSLEREGQELDEDIQRKVIAEIDQIDQQVEQAAQQAQILQAELAMARAEEQRFWQHFESTRETARFDCTIDETSNNITFRVGTLEQLMKLVQYQQPVPMESVIELLDIPIENKKAMLQRVQQMQQVQAQAVQMEQQKETNKTQLEIRKQDLGLKQALIQQGLHPETGQPLPEKGGKDLTD